MYPLRDPSRATLGIREGLQGFGLKGPRTQIVRTLVVK